MYTVHFRAKYFGGGVSNPDNSTIQYDEYSHAIGSIVLSVLKHSEIMDDGFTRAIAYAITNSEFPGTSAKVFFQFNEEHRQFFLDEERTDEVLRDEFYSFSLKSYLFTV